MTTKTIDVQETKPTLQELLALVQAGTEIILTEGATPVARLMPVEQRVPDLYPGFWMSEDFNDPLPDEFWLGEDS
jgi:prevent-host-death family protein